MNSFEEIKKLVGADISEENLRNVDCYVTEDFGLFIQSAGFCDYAIKPKHTHPSYMIVIDFGTDHFIYPPKIPLRENHYLANILHPDIPHEDKAVEFPNYYTIMIGKEYFERELSMYTDIHENFVGKQFLICHDIIKILHLFAFESSKNMMNSEVTLGCQKRLLTHWIIRSMLGENYDMRSVSSDEIIGRVQTFIELHCGENLSVALLSENAGMSVSSFNRLFKKECGMSPKNYIMKVRMNKATKLLRRNDYSVSEIGLNLGFSSAAHFSSAFHSEFGLTPSEYREKYKK